MDRRPTAAVGRSNRGRTPVTDGPVIVQSDKTLLLEVDHPRSREARHAIAPFAELERSPEHVHTYRLTPLGLWNARAAGHDAEQVIDALVRYSRYAVPHALLVDVTDTMDRYGRLRLVNDPAHGLVLASLDRAVLTGRIFAGHLRSIIGSLTVEQIIQERQKLAIEVLDGSKEEMARMGLTVDALQIQSIDDGKLGYILAIAAPHNAAIQRQAQIAQAQANQAAAEAEQISQRNQAEYARQTAVVQAQYRAEVDTAQAEAAQAGPLAKAQAQRSVIAAHTELAQREAELRQQQLVAEVVKPAEAEAERVRILAVADAEKMKIQAEAAASHNRVALDRMLICLLY